MSSKAKMTQARLTHDRRNARARLCDCSRVGIAAGATFLGRCLALFMKVENPGLCHSTVTRTPDPARAAPADQTNLCGLALTVDTRDAMVHLLRLNISTLTSIDRPTD